MVKGQTTMTVLIALVLILIVLIPGILWRAYVLSTLWGWFLVPLGVMDIEMAQAYGIALLVAMLTYEHTRSADSDDKLETTIRAIFVTFFYPLVILILGSVAHAYM
jgi:hypothetical protein